MKPLDMHHIGNVWLNLNDRSINLTYFSGNSNLPVKVRMFLKLSYYKGNFLFTLPQGDPDFNKLVYSLVYYKHLIQSKQDPWTFILTAIDTANLIDSMNINLASLSEDQDYYFNTWTRKNG